MIDRIGEKRKALFLDRDGVINKDNHYVHAIEDFEFIDGAFDALRNFQAAGYLLVIITNQSGIGRGLYSEEDFATLMNEVRDILGKENISLAAVYHCPHSPEAAEPSCLCRKPRPGMILQACEDLNIDPRLSILVGDKGSDLAAGRSAHVGHCYLVRSGHVISETEARSADSVFDNLAALSRNLCRNKDGKAHDAPHPGDE